MRTLLLSLLSTIILNFTVSSQGLYPLQDANNFISAMDDTDYVTARKILQKYFPENDTQTFVNNTQAFTQYTGIKTDPLDDSAVVAGLAEFNSNEGGAQSGTTSLGAPQMIDEIGKLIADRFREELTLAFLDGFRNKVKKDTLLGKIFPTTKNVLLYDDPFNYDNWLISFRSAMNMDLNNLPKNVPEILRGIEKMHFIKLTPEKRAELKKAIEQFILVYELGLQFAETPENSYQNTLQAIDVLHDLVADSNFRKGVKVIRPFVYELGNTSYTGWASQTSIEELRKSTNMAVFIAFTAKKHSDSLKVNFGDNSNNDVLLWIKKHSSVMNRLKGVVKEVVDQVQVVTQAISDVNRIKDRSYADYAPIIDESLSLIEVLTSDSVQSICTSVASTSDELKEILTTINKLVEPAQELNDAISKKEYGEILPITLDVVQLVIPQNILENNLFLKDILKYGNLAVALSTAETSEEFSKALTNSVLPAQSYRLKRTSLFSISVNAYAGIYGGAEYLLNTDAQNRLEGLMGFTAPIGIGLNWSCKKNVASKNGKYPYVLKYKQTEDGADSLVKSRYAGKHSVSLVFTVLDVGAVAAYRLKDDSSPAANVQWKNIISPGVYFVWGIANTPLALNVGAQYGPELRSVDAKDGVVTPVIDSRAWRFGGGLTVDIPLYNLYSKSEKVKYVTPKCKKKNKTKK